MKTSENGLNFIKKEEGFRALQYRDAGGKWTIGYGHLIEPGEVFGPISTVEALTLLLKDVHDAEECLRKYVSVSLTQNQYDALVSFVFNLGCKHLLTSTLLKKLNAGDYAGAAPEFLKWNHVAGLVNKGLTARRNREMGLFLTGVNNG